MRFTNAEGYAYETTPQVDGKPPFPTELLEKSRALLTATLAMLPPVGTGSALLAGLFARYPVHAERARATAGQLGVEPASLLAANLCYDGLMGSETMGCSTLALPGERGPLLARNMDWFPAALIARASCLIREEFGTNAGFVGMLGAVTGLSDRGFAVAINAASAGSDPNGYPVLLFLRHLLDNATGYRDALAMAEGERLMSGGIITVVGTANADRAVVERTPTTAQVRRAKPDQPLMATNHFRAGFSGPEFCPRYEHMAAHAGWVPPLDVLTSRNVLQEITAQHVVLCPGAGTAEMFVPSHLLGDGVRDETSPADLHRFLG